MGKTFVDFFFERLMPFLQFRKVRLHRHAVCLLNQWPLYDLSVAQTRHKSDRTPGAVPRQTGAKPLIADNNPATLKAVVENAIIAVLLPTQAGQAKSIQRWR